MREGDFVLYDNELWEVWLKHLDGSYQIKSVTPLRTWIDSMQVDSKDCTIVTKEVADIMRAV